MKLNRPLLLTTLLFLSILASAQDLLFKSGKVPVERNINQQVVDSFNQKLLRFASKSFLIIQFESIPTESAKKILSANGVQLLEYIPNNAYTATVSGDLKLNILQQARARSLYELSPFEKMENRLRTPLPGWAIKVAGTVDLWISFPKTFSAIEVMNHLRQLSMEVISNQLSTHRILALRVATNRLTELASYPFVEFVQLAPRGDQPLLTNSRDVSGANLLNASVADGGKGLDGEGVVVGVGDNADVQAHIDFSRRLINRSPMPLTAGHGSHVTGIVGGAGFRNEMYQGYAPKATLISQGFNGIILNAQTYVNDYGMVITNNSYGDNIECSYFGTYDLYSRLLDQMAFDFPYLQNVFSAGNSGTETCAPFQAAYHNVLGGYQSAKNVLTVGATTDSGAVAGFSSRGPVKDGRLKPEIVTMGQFVASTWVGNGYSYNNGTSMASPAASGGLALLVQRYRQLNGNADPKNGLMKAILVNGSIDRGNAGPDYQYGFGWMNLLRSIDMIENNHYFNTTVANTAANNHPIIIPANTAQLKVMLYWNDPAASPLSAKTLVNDLDLEVVSPLNDTSRPAILDTTNGHLSQDAIDGIDRLNNMEQVVINNPASGNYTLRVKGSAITQNPSQEYFLVYDIIPVQLQITSPAGGDAWHPSSNSLEMMKVVWDAYGFPTGTVTIEFSSDNGSNWSTIATGININRKVYTMFVPNVPTHQARMRVTKDVTGESSTSNAFTILARPVVTLAPVQCEGYIRINWTAVPSVTDYQVMLLQGDGFKVMTTTTGTSHTFSGLSRDSTYWFTVMPRINGRGGRRAEAISRQPSTGTCAGSISDNDLKIDAVLGPISGRMFTSSQLGSTAQVMVRIKNLDNTAANNFDLKYSVNGGPFITENVAIPVNAGATYTHTFAATADLSVSGNYNFTVVVKNTNADPVTVNDTATFLVKHLDNQPLDLTSMFTDDMETAAIASYERDTVGLTGLDRYDLLRSSIYGRLRTFINSGIAYSGNRALTLDANRYYPTGNTNFLHGTFNLVNYDTAANDLRLDFRFNSHGQLNHANNKVWIRGNDQQSWIEVYDLDDNQDDPGNYKKSSSIELRDLLAANLQNFGASFQVRWGQWGQIAATDKINAGGYTFDDVRLYEVFNDLQLARIDSPVTASCALTTGEEVTISVRNSANTTLNNIPVSYRINNGSWITENIVSIPPNSTVQYTFNTTADLSATGNHIIDALVDFPADSYRENDTLRVSIVNSPVISTFPYLESFETGTASWYTGGKNVSWEHGTPASAKISGAANGAKAWKTRLVGNYNDREFSYLYSPCFNLTGMSNPTLSFSLALDIEDCGANVCDGAWVEYSTDGVNWSKLGLEGQGTNWYNHANEDLWSIQNFTRWHVATIPIPVSSDRVRLRFVMASDPAVNREGIAVDDIHIYDNTNGIYEGPTLASPITQTASGNNWIDFTSGGKLVASINPNNQVMGATDVQAFINTAAVRHTSTQYYHDRNITIKPVNTLLGDSVTVRFYFLETEVDTLINATGCAGCTKPVSAYDLGVSKYSDPDDNFENGSVGDNNQGIWSFILPADVRMVPFDKGYYAEFKVKDFSEFWLNNGGFTASQPLPVKLLEFNAIKSGNDVVVKWKTSNEEDVSHYEIEVVRGNVALQTGQFTKIGEVMSAGNTTSTRDYSFIDNETGKTGPRYYRLKLVDLDGSYFYSMVRSVVFGDITVMQVYPNPSSGKFALTYQFNAGEKLNVRVTDVKGRTLEEFSRTAGGFVEKLNIDLGRQPAGVYILSVRSGERYFTTKLYKN